MKIIEFMRQWDHLPFSREKPCTPLSNGELRRLADQGGVLVNGMPVKAADELPELITSLVLWPKSKKHCTTWI